MKFLVINGVNLNLTGKREKGVYGTAGLDELNAKIAAFCQANGDEVDFYQSNIEGELVNKLHEAYENKSCDGILLNAGAFTHYSYALRDAIAAIDIPVAEVHISNVMEREAFRHHSFVSPIAKKTYMGLGFEGYRKAIRHLALGEE